MCKRMLRRANRCGVERGERRVGMTRAHDNNHGGEPVIFSALNADLPSWLDVCTVRNLHNGIIADVHHMHRCRLSACRNCEQRLSSATPQNTEHVVKGFDHGPRSSGHLQLILSSSTFVV